MTFTSVFGFVYALLKAIPLLEKLVREFFAFYAIKQREWFEKELHDAIKKAINSGETRDLENSIGSPRAGAPSGHDGIERDDPSKP